MDSKQEQTQPEFLDILKLKSKDLQALILQIPPKTIAQVTKESPRDKIIGNLLIAHMTNEYYVLMIEEFHKVWPTEEERLEAELQITNIITKLKSEGVISYSLEDREPALGGRFSELAQDIATTLKTLPKASADSFIQNLEKTHPAFTGKISDYALSYEELFELSDEDFSVLLKETENYLLLLALVHAEESVLKKVYQNLSSKGAALLQEDLRNLQSKPPYCRPKDVLYARKSIAKKASRLLRIGKIKSIRA